MMSGLEERIQVSEMCHVLSWKAVQYIHHFCHFSSLFKKRKNLVGCSKMAMVYLCKCILLIKLLIARWITAHLQLETNYKISEYFTVMQVLSPGRTQSKGMMWWSRELWDRISLSKYIPYFCREKIHIAEFHINIESWKKL